MREILVVSGKGGTGKTTATAAFAQLADNAVICDLDVDTPDLHLILAPEPVRSWDFHAGYRAGIDGDRCNGCGDCATACRFGAIHAEGDRFRINPLSCEGCKVCANLCPSGAIAFTLPRRGRRYESETRFGPMVHAQLFPGEENSGLLVSLLRDEARAAAKRLGAEMVLADGAPGIGCPVIASLTGVDLAVVISEPSPAGRHDLERIVNLAAHFRIPVAVILNKADINPGQRAESLEFCGGRKLPVVAEVPFDLCAVEAMVQGRTVIEQGADALAAPLRAAWTEINRMTAWAEAAGGHH
ncbi:MAG: ATP-binding protein [Rhodospirillales bacterium]|nr:ATP-binding protein [Rhodospirillales bacterium]